MELEIWHLWLFLSISLFVLEIFISSFVSVCFGIGSLIAGIIAFFSFSFTEQLLVFFSTSFLCITIIKPYIKNYLISRSYTPPSNSIYMIGKEAYVMEEINPLKNSGRVVLSGNTWKAKSQYGEVIPKGSFVEITDTDKIIVTVKSI